MYTHQSHDLFYLLMLTQYLHFTKYISVSLGDSMAYGSSSTNIDVEVEEPINSRQYR